MLQTYNYTPTYLNVMTYIHSIPITKEEKEKVGKRLVQEATEPALADAFAKIEELSKLQYDWDGEGALPISKNVLTNMKQVLLISDNSDWNNWMISPDVNATLGLQSIQSRACVSLGAKEFSYYVRKKDEKIAASHVNFEPNVFLNILRTIG